MIGRRRTEIALWIATLLIIGALAGWSISRVLYPESGSLSGEGEDQASSYTAKEAELGSTLSLTARAQWKPSAVIYNGADGTVTSVAQIGDGEVQSGTELYTVDARPSIVAEGSLPAFADIGPGDSGPHVRQLQKYLRDSGFDVDPSRTQTDRAVEAVRAWQEKMGYPVDGVVREGDIVWVDALPTRIALDEESFRNGARISAGAGEISVFSGSPQFSLEVDQQVAQRIPEHARVSLEPASDHSWKAEVGERRSSEENPDQIELQLEPVKGTAICEDECDLIPVDDGTAVRADVVLIPNKRGIVIPTAAISTAAADGPPFVTTAENKRIEVEIVQSAEGMSLVEGLAAGTQVLLTGQDGGASN
ncbi:MAG: peptidoglycan-binding domain-containing protein [Leucobacter sp.]